MNICVINRVTYTRAPIDKWVEDLNVVVISKYDVSNEYKDKLLDFIYTKDFDDDQKMFELIVKLHRKYHFERLITFSEMDILRVAKYRDLLQIEGQKYFSGLIYRDKYTMKQYAKLQGLNVPCFTKVHNKKDIEKFSLKNGFPIVIKPLNGSSSENVSIIKDSKDICDIYEEMDAEKYVNGDLYHVDCVVGDGKALFVSVSKYWNSLKESTTLIKRENNEKERTLLLADYLVDVNSFEYSLLKTEILKFLKRPTFQNGTIHAEFIISNKVAYFIEVGSRTGGLLITNIINKKYGFYMNEISFKLQCNKKVVFPIKNEKKNFGFLTILPKNKRLVKYDTEKIKNDSYVMEFFPNAKIMEKYANISESTDQIGMLIFSFSDKEERNLKLKHLNNLINQAITWD